MRQTDRDMLDPREKRSRIEAKALLCTLLHTQLRKRGGDVPATFEAVEQAIRGGGMHRSLKRLVHGNLSRAILTALVRDPAATAGARRLAGTNAA